jgi:hypothetical protein
MRKNKTGTCAKDQNFCNKNGGDALNVLNESVKFEFGEI